MNKGIRPAAAVEIVGTDYTDSVDTDFVDRAALRYFADNSARTAPCPL